MLAKVLSAAVVGLNALPVEVEVDISAQGLPNFFIVGLPDKAVDEARERVRSAIRNSGGEFPARRITVNLAPADLPKEGPMYDLPIALGILLASEQLKADVSGMLFTGELSLDGRIRKGSGILPQVMMARSRGISDVFLPKGNATEAGIIDSIAIHPVSDLLSLFHHLTKETLIMPIETIPFSTLTAAQEYDFDMKDIKGQQKAKRAMEIAAAGGHNILLKGPPGAGKTLLARTLPSILPRLTFEETLEVTKIYSVAGQLQQTVITHRPFRSPHHTISLAGLIGGSSNPRPGEITLAHRGVLFLDEFPEFPRNILEGLRQPIEDGIVTISRAAGKTTFPAKCMLVAAQNPCPCGYFGDKFHNCTCNPLQIQRYQKKISGPLLDRIDIHLEVPAIKIEKLTAADQGNTESSEQVRERVQQARDKQTARYTGTTITSNADLSNKTVKEFCPLTEEAHVLLRQAVAKLNLSGRSFHRVLKLSRTIADLINEDTITVNHVAEALQYRPKAQEP